MDSLLFRKLSNSVPFDVHSSKVEGPRVSSVLFRPLVSFLFGFTTKKIPYCHILFSESLHTLLPALSLEKTSSTTRFLPIEQYYRCYSINIIVLVVIY